MVEFGVISTASTADPGTLDEVTRGIRHPARQDTGAQGSFREGYERTSQIIESRFERRRAQSVQTPAGRPPASLADLDRDVAELVDGYLSARAVKYGRSDEAGRVVFDIAPGGALPVEVRGWPAIHCRGRESAGPPSR